MKKTLLLIAYVCALGVTANAGPFIAANVSSGNLVLNGGGDSKGVQLSQNLSGDWVVKGLSSTRINGSLLPQTFVGVSNLTLLLGSGNDVIRILNGSGANNIVIAYGPGDKGIKQTTLGNITANSINYTYSENLLNVVVISNTVVQAGMAIVTGDGGSRLNFKNCSATSGSLVAVAGDGDNKINYNNVEASSSMVVVTGNGANFINLTDSGSDASSLVVVPGAGNANVALNNCFADSGVVVTSSGRDTVKINHFSANTLTVVPGPNADTVLLNDISVNNLDVSAGPGTGDIISVQNSSATNANFSETDGHGIIKLNNNSFGTLNIDPNLISF